MKIFLRFILILFVVLIAGILVLALIEPKDITVTRSILIKAPKDVVFNQIVNFKNWNNWSPWYEKDPKMQLTYSGTDGMQGSAYHWVGTDSGKTGEGDMKNMGVNGTALNYEVDFTKPMKNVAQGTLKAEDTAGMTKATWTMSMHFKFPWNAMGAFMNMEKMLGPDFEKGLSNIKKYVESQAVTLPGITEVQFPGHVYIGIRSIINWKDMEKAFAEEYSTIQYEHGVKIEGPTASAIYYEWDTVKKQADVAVCYQASDTVKKLSKARYFTIAPSKAVMYVLKGGYSGEMNAHTGIMRYIMDKGMTPTLVLEEYPIGKLNEPDSNKWVTNIYYLVK